MKRLDGRLEQTPIPHCGTCGEETRRLASRDGKGLYQCINRDCSDRSWYERESSKRG